MKNSIKNIQNNDGIANAYDHLTPKDFPIAYKAKKWFFCGLPFYVNVNVLVPRIDTEILVEEVVSQAGNKVLNILDLCTGSGCIAIALAKQTRSSVHASDICDKALRVAKKNAKAHKVKINFFQSDLLKNAFEQFDIIVCNPPYIKTVEIGKYDKSILHEPQIALDGGADGLDMYRRIIASASGYLTKNGQIFFEIGDKQQAEQVKTLLQQNGFYDIQIIKDRVVIASRHDGEEKE